MDVFSARKRAILQNLIRQKSNQFQPSWLRKVVFDATFGGSKYGKLMIKAAAESEPQMFGICSTLRDKPRYLMGVGYAVDLVVCSALGVDMYDCVYPTRTARFGSALIAKHPGKGG